MKKAQLPKPKMSLVSMAIGLALTNTAIAEDKRPKINTKDKQSEIGLETIRVEGRQHEKYKTTKAHSHKYTQPLIDTPKTINVINEQVLQDQNIDNLNDALRNVSGVSTFGAGEGGGGDLTTNDTITIRGFDADNSIYIDGIRDISGYSRDVFNVEAIEVAKGGNSSITGKGSAGGTINLVSKKASQITGGFVDASANTIENKRLHIDYNTPLTNNIAARINLLASDGHDPLDNDVVEYKTYGIAPTFMFNISDKTQAELGFLYIKQDHLPSLGLPFVTESVAASSGLPVGPISDDLWDNYYGVKSRDFEDVEVARSTFVLTHELNDKASLRFATRYADSHKQSITGRPNFLNEGSRAAPDYSNRLVSTALVIPGLAYIDARDERNKLFVTQLDGIFEASTGSIKHDIVVGGEYYSDKLIKKDISSSTVTLSTLGVDLFNPDQNVTFTGAYQALPVPAETEGKGLAVYAFDTLTFNEQWQASTGLRWENYELKGSQYYTVDFVTRERALATGLKSKVDLFSWNFGLLYKPTENSSLYLSAANSQEPLGGNLRFSGRNPAAFEERSNIDPEDSTSYELGTKWLLFDERLMLNAAIFQTERTIIDSASRNAPVSLSGEQTSKGFEFSALGQINEELSLSASYTYLDTEITKTAQLDAGDLGNGLSAAPDHTANIWLTYEPSFAQEKLMLGGGVRYSSGDVFFRRNRAFFETGSFTVWSFVASYRVTDALKAQMNIENIFDQDYITDFSARGHFRPGNPRHASFSVSYNF